MWMRSLAVAAALLALGGLPARALETHDARVAAMRGGRELFEKSCRLCHGLDRSLYPARDATLWPQIVKRMVAYGAPLNAAQRPLVVRYLSTRSIFTAKCGRCHDSTRVVNDSAGPRDWQALDQRMDRHQREHQAAQKAAADSAFTPDELADIAALLQVVIP